jgi:CRISPR system Cascade subunit CasA
MTTENRFNLINEAWIPFSSHGLVGLQDVFQNQEYLELAANPIEKIAITKLLLAIAQSACKESLENSEDWERLGYQGVTDKCLKYLDKWHDRFYVQRKEFTDAELALIILVLMNFALGGKNIDNSIILSLNYFGKFSEKGQEKKSGMPGTSLGARGFLHNFLQGETLLQTIWLNLFTSDGIAENKIYRV